jgi:hypothetical protein
MTPLLLGRMGEGSGTSASSSPLYLHLGAAGIVFGDRTALGAQPRGGPRLAATPGVAQYEPSVKRSRGTVGSGAGRAPAGGGVP